MASDYSGSRSLFGNPRGTADQNRYLFWATGAKMPSGTLVSAASGSNYVMTRLVFGSPSYAIDHLRLHYPGYASTEGGNSPQETVLPGNDMVIDGVWAEVGGVVTRFAFGGTPGATIASNSNGAWTDALTLPAPVAADSLVTVYTLYHTAVGQNQIPSYGIEEARGERMWSAGDAASLIALIGTDAPSSTTPSLSANTFYGPDFLLAKGWDGRPVPLLVCDSVGERKDDTIYSASARRAKGWLRRWLDMDGPFGRIPCGVIGLPGASSARELSTNSSKRWDVVDEIVAFNGGKRPFTCLIDQHCLNDHNTNYATMKNNWKGLLTRILARHPGTPVIAVGVTPRTSSTDNWLSVANQTPATGSGGAWPGGNNYLLDADKAAGMDGMVGGFIGLTDTIYSGLNGKWPAAWTTTLVAQAGTDGTTGYGSIRIANEPVVGELLRWGSGGAQLGTVTGYSGTPGDWLVDLDRMTNVAVSPVGAPVFSSASSDGIHPRLREILRIATMLPQSGKALLR